MSQMKRILVSMSLPESSIIEESYFTVVTVPARLVTYHSAAYPLDIAHAEVDYDVDSLPELWFSWGMDEAEAKCFANSHLTPREMLDCITFCDDADMATYYCLLRELMKSTGTEAVWYAKG